MGKRPLVIDCDPGIDDFVAILLAHSSGQFDIRAVTTLGGNVRPEYTAANARDLAALLGLSCPVGKGAEKPLMGELVTAEYVHGREGLGGVSLPPSPAAFDPRPAWDILYEEACCFPGQLEVAAIGPLTNIAIFLRKYPEGAGLLKKLHIMGGSTETGNHSAYGEFNIWEDPLAADIVFRSGVPLRMVGLNCTAQGRCDCAIWQEGLQGEGTILSILRELMAFECAQAKLWMPGVEESTFVPELPDAVAIGGMIDSAALTCRDYPVLIEVNGPLTYGRTLVDWDGVTGAPLNCEVALWADPARMSDLYRQMFAFYREGERG